MFTAAEDFFKAMPDSSLQHVYICCYHNDKELIKVKLKMGKDHKHWNRLITMHLDRQTEVHTQTQAHLKVYFCNLSNKVLSLSLSLSDTRKSKVSVYNYINTEITDRLSVLLETYFPFFGVSWVCQLRAFSHADAIYLLHSAFLSLALGWYPLVVMFQWSLVSYLGNEMCLTYTTSITIRFLITCMVEEDCPNLISSGSCVTIAIQLKQLGVVFSASLFQIKHAVFQTD